MKIVIIGGSFAGIQGAITSREYYPEAEIVLLEKQPEIGYIPGSLALFLQGKVNALDQLHWRTAEELRNDYQIDVRCNQQVVALEAENQIRLDTNETVPFDRLIVATGSGQFSRYSLKDPQEPQARIVRFKTRSEAQLLVDQLPTVAKIAIIGAGQVGLELAEGLAIIGKQVHLFESNSQLLFRYLDEEMTEPLVKAVEAKGVVLQLNTFVEELVETEEVVTLTTAEKQEEFDLVLIATSVRPDNSLWENALTLNDDGTIWVDQWMQTSRTNVFAVGDAVQVIFRPTGESMYSSLVNNALRTAKVAAVNLAGPKQEDQGTLRTVGNQLFGYYVGSTGLTESEGIFYPTKITSQVAELSVSLLSPEKQRVKLIFDNETEQLLGAQIVSPAPVLEKINQLAEAIRLKQTKTSLRQSEEYFHPALNLPETLFLRGEDRHAN
ncbi:FAD-dependent oxidoreductase [Enterococcus sp. AZ109]|uniref:FAD-dependent oxidoreductase n=1 Tax=Enterococcus sp. AZ109 TaxID=2774634 RepID=UPI003F232330